MIKKNFKPGKVFIFWLVIYNNYHGFGAGEAKFKLELWVTSLGDTHRLQHCDVQTLEYRYISKLPLKNERIWSYVKETTSHLQNKLTKNIHLGVATSTRPPFHESISWIISPSKFDSNGIPSCTSAVCVLQLCKVS